MNKQLKVETVEAGEGLQLSALGGVVFVSPAGGGLTADQFADVERAWELADLGATSAAAAILGHVERDLGVGQEDHIAAVLAGEPRLAARRRCAQDRVQEGQLSRGQQLAAAMALPPLNEATLLNLQSADAAREQVEHARKVGDRHAVKLGQAAVRRYHDRAARLRREQLDAAWAHRAEAETVEIATRRGEHVDTVEVLAEDGPLGLVPSSALRISSRDGLRSLFESQDAKGAWQLTDIQYKAGRAFRALHEVAHAGLRVQTFEGSGPGRRPGEGFNPKRATHELERAGHLAQLAKVERAVCPALPQMNRALIVLRWIAGDGHTLSSLSSGGNAKTANLKALRHALDVAASILAPGACESGTT